MAWDTECIVLLRAMIADDQTPYEFSDLRLKQLLITSMFQVYQRVGSRFALTYSIDVVNLSVDPDPAGTSLTDPNRNETMVDLTVLKAACTLQKGAIRKAAGTGFALKDGPTYVDTRGKASALLDLLKSGKSFCQDYDDALQSYLTSTNGAVAAAVIGPYRIGLGAGGARRDGGGYGDRYFG